MSKVEFNEEEEYAGFLSRKGKDGVRGLARLIIRLGFAKDETGANIVLIGAAVAVGILAAVLIFTAS